MHSEPDQLCVGCWDLEKKAQEWALRREMKRIAWSLIVCLFIFYQGVQIDAWQDSTGWWRTGWSVVV
jgi:hypothetical protein